MSETLPEPMFPTFAAAWRQLRSCLRQFRSLLRQLRHTRLRDVLRGHIDGSLDWRKKLIEAELPPEITFLIQKFAGRRRLWHRERRDIATELIAHFQDGLDAGQSAESLVESFGDAKQAAKLTLRAKRRCRPFWWQAWWWASRSTAILVACYTLMAFWLGSVRPSISTDYVAVLNQPGRDTPEAELAWPIYREALRQLYAAHNGRIDSWRLAWGDFSAEQRRVWLDQHAELVEGFRKAASRPELGFLLGPGRQGERDYAELRGKDSVQTQDLEEDWLIGLLLPHGQDLGAVVAEILEADALANLEKRNGTAAYQDIESLLGVARHAGRHGFLVNALMQIGIDRRAFQTVETIQREHGDLWTENQLKQLAHRIATLEYDLAEWTPAERLWFLDVVQRLYSDDGEGDGFLTAKGLKSLDQNLSTTSSGPTAGGWTSKPLFAQAVSPALPLVFASRREVIAKYDELTTLAITESRTPLWRRELPHGTFDQVVWKLEKKHPIRFSLISLLLPQYTSITELLEYVRGRRDGVLIGIALELYRRENGAWPTTLDELAPRWLPELPVDRINGGSLGYQLIDGKPVVYSLGVDSDDDHGRLPRSMDDDQQQERGFATTDRYDVGPPLTDEKRSNPQRHHFRRDPLLYDGDWVIWSLAEPRYVPHTVE